MSVDVLVLLFVLFSVASSIFKKIQGRAQENARPTPDIPETEEELADEIDLSEWEVFRDEPTPSFEPEPSAAIPVAREFQEIRGTRQVEEPRGAIEEFQAIRGARPVEEIGKTPEFQPVQGKRHVTEAPGELEITRDALPTLQAKTSRRRRRVSLKLNPQSVREGILYSEILGPPRADKVLW